MRSLLNECHVSENIETRRRPRYCSIFPARSYLVGNSVLIPTVMISATTKTRTHELPDSRRWELRDYFSRPIFCVHWWCLRLHAIIMFWAHSANNIAICFSYGQQDVSASQTIWKFSLLGISRTFSWHFSAGHFSFRHAMIFVAFPQWIKVAGKLNSLEI